MSQKEKEKGRGRGRPRKSPYAHKNAKTGCAYDPNHPIVKEEIELARSLVKRKRKPNVKYSEEIGDRICELIASWPRSVEELCKNYPDLPHRAAIFQWIVKYPEFAEKYARAKRFQIESYIDETIAIADDDSCDMYLDPETNEYKVNNAIVARAKIRIDIRKWQAAKLMPHIWGDRQTIDTNITIKSHEQALKELEGEIIEHKSKEFD